MDVSRPFDDGRNTTLSLEYLGPVAVFQWNVNLREVARTSSPNIAHSARMQGTFWNLRV